jgi:hypothetical protein
MAQATDLARAHAAARVALVDAAEAEALSAWSMVNPDNIVDSWTLRVPNVVVMTGGAQLAAARRADSYVGGAIEAQGIPRQRGPRVLAKAFVGASSGDLLAPMLYQPVIAALAAIGKGATPQTGLQTGAHLLSTIVRTQVADAGRLADQVAITAHREVSVYVRTVVGKTCARCLVLAGREYRWSQGFKRHPRCDCAHMPTTRAETAGLVTHPRREYDALSPAERRAAGWTEADQQAIASGADIFRVTNAKRGVYTAGGRQFTREGKARDTAGRRVARITPDQIFAEAAGDREEAIRLLRRHGYLAEV